ncbi:MAG: aminotransferase class I/II-fold pyridoxal phosphate-dependent enzyme, partial [Gammaproteobacteria bacterium]|nr:aminotransferase class I/II-fold pyridoxal phosphate-dependent enzyme [Gammaproteobacteria bacterium]
PGDEILIPDPYWVSYGPCAQMAGAIPISVPSRFADGFYPRIEDIEARITSKTRMLVINSPHNPTGAVYGKDILDKLARLAIKHNLYVLSDEIYERIIYDGNEHISIGALPNMRERTITINGMSKIYSMTGWRLGYVAAEKSVIEALVRIRQNTTACATTFAQWGGLEALNGSQEESTNMVAEFERRRNFLFAALQKIPGLQVVKPGGAFYFLVSVEELMQPAEQVAMYLLEEAGVAVVPGTAFGNYGEGLLRISYANSYQNLVLAAARMCAALEKCHAIS